MREFKYGVHSICLKTGIITDNGVLNEVQKSTYNVIHPLVFLGKEDTVIIVYFVYCKSDFCIEMRSNLLIFVL